MIPIASTRNCTVPYFGFKAKHAGKCSMWNNIVLCLILDSRQNIHCSGSFLLVLYCALFWIQGKTRANAAIDAAVLYCALFWIQGKTKRGPGNHGYRLYCALFWIQGKTPMWEFLQRLILYCALFWIQGKTNGNNGSFTLTLYCALFWIQGKTLPSNTWTTTYCTVPYFGFKAKQVHASYRLAGIVLCLILDSRQNYRPR